jgi:hypothetical protein
MRTVVVLWTLLLCLAGLAGCGGSAEGFGPNHATSPASAPMEAYGGMPAPDVDKDAVMDAEDASSGDEMYRFQSGAVEGKREERSTDLAKGAPPPPPAQNPAQAGGAQAKPGQAEAVAARAPLLIYTAQVTMAVFEVNESLSKVEAIAKDLGGFLARRDDRAITIRIPVARFDEALRRIEDAGDMLHRNVAVEDVTEEYLDLEIRLRNARAVRDRLEKLLEKAASVEESVLLEKELGRVAGEIERLEGRMKYLRDRAAFSTITVTFQPRPRESIDPSGAKLPVSWLNNLGLARLLNL